jgi:myo-inositol-1(or 4)-monophosphatase
LPATDLALAGLDEDLDLIATAAAEAASIAMRYFGRKPEVWLKGGTSPVSEADLAVDRFLREGLLAARSDYGWLSEETADNPDRLAARRSFIVDPIDGTRAFIDGRDTWGVSVAVVEDGRPLAGVFACPAKRETFSARLGGGAWLNGRRLAVAEAGAAPRIGGPRKWTDQAPKAVREAMRTVPYIPSLAYRVAMVAAARIDATFVKPNSHDWDLAAVDLILGEAGGMVLNSRGERPYYGGPNPTHGALVAGSGPLLGLLARVVAANPD